MFVFTKGEMLLASVCWIASGFAIGYAQARGIFATALALAEAVFNNKDDQN